MGLYPTNSSAVNEFILQDSRADVIVVEDEKQVKFLCEAYFIGIEFIFYFLSFAL